ncbi:MAG: adenine phosphoribosyltransferase [Myxococcota bacterium]
MSNFETELKALIRDIPDFPKAGILFRDITPVLQNPVALKRVIDAMAEAVADLEFDTIVAIESRGFIFGVALGYAMGKGVALVRKPGKLPAKTEAVSYVLEYGTDTLEIHTDAVEAGHKVLIVDDLLATGGTAEATCQLVEKLGASVATCLFLIELGFLNGRDKLGDRPVTALVHY